MELIPRLIWLGTTIDQRYNLLLKIGDVAMEAAAWAISAQAFDLAVEWLEEGRSIIWNQILQLRTPFEELFAADSALAQRMKDTALRLERAGSRSATYTWSVSSDLEKDTQNYHRLATEWEGLLQQARDSPGFQNFMRPRKFNELKGAAKEGPLVLINTHSTHCDALVILPHCEGVVHIPLEGFSCKEAANARAQLQTLVGY